MTDETQLSENGQRLQEIADTVVAAVNHMVLEFQQGAQQHDISPTLAMGIAAHLVPKLYAAMLPAEIERVVEAAAGAELTDAPEKIAENIAKLHSGVFEYLDMAYGNTEVGYGGGDPLNPVDELPPINPPNDGVVH